MNKIYIAVQKAVQIFKKQFFVSLITFILPAVNFAAEVPGNKGKTIDASPPVITYTPLASTCSSTGRSLTATITDVADGVPTTGLGRPVLYWRINSGSLNASTGNFIGSNQFTFALGTGAPAGSLVSYYIVAQDAAGNVIASPSAGAGGYTTSPPAAAIDPTTPSFYVVQNTLAAGTYTVGAGGAQNYLTITDAVNAYNNSCLSGAVTFLLMDVSYPSEIFPITINNPAASAANSLTIKPNIGVNVAINGSSSEAILKFNGADFITLDGSNSGGTTRNLTITNTNTGISSAVVWVASASASNPATNDTIRNCIMVGNASTTTLAGIVSSSGVTVGAAAEAANANNRYLNNAINTCYYGIIAMGPSGNESGTVISGNNLGSGQAAKKLGYRGILVSNQTNVLVNNNTIAGILSTFGLGSDIEPTAGITISGNITGGSIYSNNISDVKNSNTSGWQAFGISLQSSNAASGTKIYNNFIFNITGYGDDDVVAENGHGIAVMTGGGYGIFNNSVNLYINQTVGGHNSCIFIGTAVSGTVDIRNNILSNRRTTGIRYALYSSLPNTVFSNINYNDYYSTELVGFLTIPRATIASWQAATGSDGNSVVANPIFVSSTDLHLQLISPLNDQGISIAGITTDIDGDTRNPAPDIGADEFTPPPCTNNLGGTITASNTTVCDAGSVILSSTGFSYGLGIAYQWQYSTDNVTWNALPGETNPTIANPPSITVTTWYRLRVTCNNGIPGNSNSLQVTVYNPQVLSTTPASRCGPGTVSLAATGTPTTNIEWYTTPTGGAPLYTGSPFTTPSLSATTTFYAQSTYPGSSGSVGPNAPLTPLTITSTQYTPWQVYFTVLQATTLLTVDVYPLAIGETSTIDVYRGPIAAPTLIASVPYTTTVGGGATAQVIPLNVPLLVGTDYFLYATPTPSNPTGLPPAGLRRDITSASYPYNSTDIQITGNEFDQNYYMCYYRWRFSNGCGSSPRTPVVATISASVPITVSVNPSAICSGDSSVLSASSADAGYVYTWNPGNLPGNTVTVFPTSSTTYTVTAVDGLCNTSGSVSVIVNASPSNVTIAPADSVTKCASSPAQLLTASGGAIAGANILSENFNGASTPSGWVTATTWAPTAGVSTGTPAGIAACAWTLRPSGYSYAGTSFISNDTTQFYLSNSDANAAVTRTLLRTPAFSLTGYTSATLNFWHYYASSGDGSDSVCVEISQNLSTWVNILSYKTSRGASTAFANVNVILDAYLGQATNYIRFRYYGTDDYQWAIDNVKITGQNSSTSFVWAPTTGLFTNPGASTAYTGTATPTVYAKPLVTTSYIATATAANGCKKSDTIKVIVKPLTGVISGNSTGCPGSNAVITVTFTGTGPWNFSYSDGTLTFPVTGVASSPYTFTVNPLITTTYTLSALSDASCTASPADLSGSAVVNVTVTAVSTWLGINSDWMNPLNWCGGVPVSTKDVVIPVGTPFYPIITNALPVAKGINIAVGANIAIDAGGTLSFTGIFVNNGILTNNGRLVLNGSAPQSFPGGTTGIIAAMNDLEVNNIAGATINRRVVLTGTLKPKSGNITISDTVVLHSDASGTARVDTVQGTISYSGVGKFSVERYISTMSDIAWRFLSAPITGSQTINQAWQEGQATGDSISTGYGMQIIGPSAAGPGFDLNTLLPSVKKYNPAANAWVSIPGTTGPISASDGYMAFIRGDRDANIFGEQSPTTLRMSGPIKTGNIGPLSTPNPSTFISVGNPYPSAIDYSATTRVGLQDYYYLWDPKVGAYGGYQTFGPGPGYPVTPGGGSYAGGNKFIESGMAFFVVSTAGAAPHNISITENDKVSGSNQVARLGDLVMNLRTNLHLLFGGTASLYDGVRVDFDAAFSNEVDDDDARKLSNFGENLGLMRQEKTLSVERRTEIVDSDTIFYTLGQLRQQQYQMEFIPEQLAVPGLTAFLEDAYLNTTTVISLEGISLVNFSVNGEAGSYASNRFRLVFRQLGPVPVTFTSVWARKQNKDILIGWKVENETNIDHYEIEKSADGRNFSKAGTQVARGNGGSSLEYSFLDHYPLNGDNFYRIRSVGMSNEIKYTSIVKVNINVENGGITIYPNPVKTGLLGISMNDQPKGEYTAQIFSQKGELMITQNFIHPGGSQKFILDVSHSLTARGIYRLEIALLRGGKKGRKLMENVMFE